ncbi:type VI secretion system ImpA/VasJ family protein [Bradyrhizobium sp. CIR18]|uniref:type VI secretion system ImpA family N-terminal domain-containing protein n=1 Tax=Bradyrhizobium sp. CIR18 TaxID=2663839 RepID=UPI001606D146|nr:type VI secretion system ImpA family N-terminal domain-containing protein [Bradyrhizobium sp. CIR18]MBB4365324.1 type VI secretion system ImpA/VasJ family protein [Bradyrhizobium sp. CIR18]
MIDYWIMVRADIAARSSRGATPVPGSAPAGAHIRDGAEFKRLEAEVRRAERDCPSGVDWGKISTRSLDILSSQSKDILVACWATYGLFRVEGYVGLAVGLALLQEMVDAHWEGLFPPIKHARIGALDWLVARLAPAVAETAPTEADASAVVIAYDALHDLVGQLSGKLVDKQLTLEVLLRTLQSSYEQATCTLVTATEHAAEAVLAAERAQSALADPTSPG